MSWGMLFMPSEIITSYGVLRILNKEGFISFSCQALMKLQDLCIFWFRLRDKWNEENTFLKPYKNILWCTWHIFWQSSEEVTPNFLPPERSAPWKSVADVKHFSKELNVKRTFWKPTLTKNAWWRTRDGIFVWPRITFTML